MKSTYIYIGLVVLIVVGLVIVRNNSERQGATAQVTKYDDFAQCLGDAGAKFYGAFWCPHCAEQKALFEKSAKLPYIECSTPDSKGQMPICATEKIEGYPTWKFADGEVINKVMQLSELAEKTSCPLPTV